MVARTAPRPASHKRELAARFFALACQQILLTKTPHRSIDKTSKYQTEDGQSYNHHRLIITGLLANCQKESSPPFGELRNLLRDFATMSSGTEAGGCLKSLQRREQQGCEHYQLLERLLG